MNVLIPGIQVSELNGRNMLINTNEYIVVKKMSRLIFSLVTRNDGRSLLPKRNEYFFLLLISLMSANLQKNRSTNEERFKILRMNFYTIGA